MRAVIAKARRHIAVGAAAISLAIAACTAGVAPRDASATFRMPPANRGSERYSAWFADTDGEVLYFGLSPFWQLYWQTGGNATADLETPGDHLIGRFDLAAEAFLPPLRVRDAGPDVRGSVWDVLVHRTGRVYYTTFYEEVGYVDPRTGDVVTRTDLGYGLNELAEGESGRLYATRYTAPGEPGDDAAPPAVVVLSPQLELIRTLVLPQPVDAVVAPKSVAVDPRSGEIWVNADRLRDGSAAGFATFRLASDGSVLEYVEDVPELLFMRFDARGRGWFVSDVSGVLWLDVKRAGERIATASLGPRAPLDFVQDIAFAPDGAAVLALWSGRVVVAREDGGTLRVAETRFALPADCAPPRGRALLYTAVPYRDALYGTLCCGPTVLRTRLPPARDTHAPPASR
jgi:hypothetical protein